MGNRLKTITLKIIRLHRRRIAEKKRRHLLRRHLLKELENEWPGIKKQLDHEEAGLAKPWIYDEKPPLDH